MQDPDDWSWSVPYWLIPAWTDRRDKVLFLLMWKEKWGRRFDERLTGYDILRELWVTMPRKKGSPNDNANKPSTNRFGKSGDRNEWKWVNLELSDDDLSELEQSQATLEYLAACAVGLGDEGIGITVVPCDEGKSFRFTFYGSVPGVANVTFGVSSYGGTIRDALLVGLYKFDILLGGDFDTVKHNIDTEKPRRRFR